MQIPNLKFATVSGYRDTLNGWKVRQMHFSLQDYSCGVLLYLIQYCGTSGTLHGVYAGLRFDFDVPDQNNSATADDDLLDSVIDGYLIKDIYTNRGMVVQSLLPNLIGNYWVWDDFPGNLAQIYQHMSTTRQGTPADTADYHFYLGNGPFTVNSGESIVLAYLIQPFDQGFSKDNTDNIDLENGLAHFKKGKQLAKIDQRKFEKRNLNARMPVTYSLAQNYPNPFNPFTGIRFSLPENSRVKLEVFNTLGQKVKTLVDRQADAGTYTMYWNGTDNAGNRVSSGIYIYRLTTRKFQSQKKMLFIR